MTDREKLRASLLDLLRLGFELKGDRAEAIAYAKARSCAGTAIWAAALVKWETPSQDTHRMPGRDALASEAPTQEEIERERLNWWPPARE